MPPVCDKPGFNALRKSYFCISFNGNVIVVIDINQAAQMEVAGDRSCFRTDSLHHITVTANHINIVIEKFKSRFAVPVSQPLLGDAHTYTICESLAERAGCGFDTRR